MLIQLSDTARQDALDALRTAFADRLLTSQSSREHHQAGESWHRDKLPDAVLMVQSTEDVVTAVTICRAHKFPLIPYGAGTSVEGHVVPTLGGLTLDFSEMNAILAVSPEDFTVTVQPGITRKTLDAELRTLGLMFTVDPGADASIGGMVATSASGTTTVKYGTMRENVVSLTVVTADGRVIQTAKQARKTSAGYDLTSLFVGSEGTLGVITEVTLKLHPVPEAISAAVSTFPHVAAAVDAVIATLQHAVPVARIELLDGVSMAAVNAYSHMAHPEQPTLFLEFHGSETAVAEIAALVGEIFQAHGSSDFVWKTKQEERSALWAARHSAAWAVMAQRPGCKLMSTDVCVPISKLATIIETAQAQLAEAGIYAALLGHVGDGNFHFVIPAHPEDTAEFAKIEAFCHQLAQDAIALEGTCTGEHGIGLGKQKYLPLELGEAVDAMVLIKQAFDPDNIMNPGKIFQNKT